jgi:membrane protease YdiL (CAAX protease family)/tetratricopeptide (TPR) repeat protein
MEVTHCPHCGVRVMPGEDGSCPSCGRNVVPGAEDSVSAANVEQTQLGDELGRASPAEGPVVEESSQAEAAESPVHEQPRKMGFLTAIGWCVVVVLAQLCLGCVLGLALGVTGLLPAFRENFQLAVVVFEVVGFLIMAAVAWNNLPRAGRKSALRRIRPLHVVLVLLLAPPLNVLCEEIGNWLSLAADAIISSAGLEPLAAAIAAPSTATAYTGLFDQYHAAIALQPWPIMLLVGCLAPGICEELFFRGFLGQGLLARYGAVGIVLTSVLFGLAHIDPVHASWTFLLGIFLHCVYLWTRSLWGSVILHIVFNIVGFSFSKLVLEGTIVAGGTDGCFWVPPPLSAAALFAVSALIVVLYRSRVQPVSPSDGAADQSVARSGVAGTLFVATAAGAYVAFGAALVYWGSAWLDHNGAWARIERAAMHAEQQDYEQAVKAYTAAIEADPELAEAWFGRGEAHRMLGDLEQALRDDERGLEITPSSAWGYADRGETCRLLGRLDEALLDCNRAIRHDPQFGWGYTVRGYVHSDLGDSRPAIDDYLKSIRLEPENANAWSGLAWEYANATEPDLRDTEEAVRCAVEACELTAWSDAHVLATLAQAYAQDGQLEKAARYQRDALDAAPPEAEEQFREVLEFYQQES